MNGRTQRLMEGRKFDVVLGNGFPLAAYNIPRNAECPCGSGKKAKNCCGTDTKYAYSKLNGKQLLEKREKEEAAAAARKKELDAQGAELRAQGEEQTANSAEI